MVEQSRPLFASYFADVAEDMRRETEKLRRDFATHAPSGGENREAVVADFLRKYLPKNFGIDTGLVFSRSGQFSQEADLVIVDQAWNAPLHPEKPNRIWFVEAVYALIEVKTHLHPGEIRDAVQKCRRFKQLPRIFDDQPAKPRITDSLFVLWGFESPSPATVKKNLIEALTDVPINEQPDLVIVPDTLVGKAGTYHEVTTLGYPTSPHRQQLLDATGGDLTKLGVKQLQIAAFGNYSLLAWLVWTVSWLKAAGPRSAPLLAYVPVDIDYGTEV